MPGNRLVIPRISRTGTSATSQAILTPRPAGAGTQARPRRFPHLALDRRRELQRARDDLSLVLVHEGDVRLRNGRVDLPDAHPAVREREQQVGVALERAVLDGLRDLHDAEVDA